MCVCVCVVRVLGAGMCGVDDVLVKGTCLCLFSKLLSNIMYAVIMVPLFERKRVRVPIIVISALMFNPLL